MMYYKQISPIGCFLWVILLVWLFIKLKLYYLIVFIIFIVLIYNFVNKTKIKIQEHNEEKEKNFEPEIGEVYKICSFCGNNVKRSAKICPHCKNSLE